MKVKGIFVVCTPSREKFTFDERNFECMNDIF